MYVLITVGMSHHGDLPPADLIRGFFYMTGFWWVGSSEGKFVQLSAVYTSLWIGLDQGDGKIVHLTDGSPVCTESTLVSE